MSSGIHAIAHIGKFKVYVGDVSMISKKWPLILASLNSGTYPDTVIQQAWNIAKDKRRFSYHTWKEIVGDRYVLGMEELAEKLRY